MSTKSAPSHEAISDRARKIWEAEGQPEGNDLEHWLRAERELAEESAATDDPEDEDSKSAVVLANEAPALLRPRSATTQRRTPQVPGSTPKRFGR